MTAPAPVLESVTMNLDTIPYAIRVAVSRSVHHAARALAAPVPEVAEVGDGFTSFRITPFLRTPEAMAGDYETWVTNNVVRELIESVCHSLERARQAVTFSELWRSGPPLREVVQDYMDKRAETERHFDWKPFPKKLSTLADLGVAPAANDNIVSINKARNVLAHHKGIVPEKDGVIRVRWRTLVNHAVYEDGTEEPLVYGQRMRGTAQILARFVDVERVFNVGDRIRFNLTEITGICMSFHFYAEELTALVVEALKRNNYMKT